MTLDLDEFILDLFARLSLPRMDEKAVWKLAEACRLFLHDAETEDPSVLVAELAARFQVLRGAVENNLAARLAAHADAPGELQAWLQENTEKPPHPCGERDTEPKTITERTKREPGRHRRG